MDEGNPDPYRAPTLIASDAPHNRWRDWPRQLFGGVSLFLGVSMVPVVFGGILEAYREQDPRILVIAFLFAPLAWWLIRLARRELATVAK